ncbi:ATP-dependent DNA helicase RecQ [Olsenella umbonata]|uniref:ATP-dependent DNA helicase RecQ n=2 Tax=Parafannyhessea umbonata TaxID=604330 RepID=A0A7X9XZH6_9ACTN|nr:ATP-dependent DNA helicase RecQ [Parafannyhessea umbonata]
MADAEAALARHFGYASFRPGQAEVIRAVLAGRDALAVMPTGAGKSVCYQVPAALMRGLTIVVSPLISLMGDQVRGLREAGIRGSYLNSSLTPRQQVIVMARALDGWYDLMYVAPERLADPSFRAFAARVRVPLLAVDEAHCVSQWGQDFRLAYTGIADFVAGLPARPPVVALTATATERVRRDVVSLIGLEDPQVTVTGFDRPNLSFASFELKPKERVRWVCAYAAAHPDESGIVYATTRKRVDELAQALRESGVAAVSYHAGYEADAREEAQRRFVMDDARVMVATNAFGMGIDKSNVRFVVNCGLPLSLEEYYQEAGRAGRDGEPAECYLLWSRGDIRTCRFLIDRDDLPDSTPAAERQRLERSRRALLNHMIDYAQSTTCLRRRILSYFGQDVSALPQSCGSCSVCTGASPDRYLAPAATSHAFGHAAYDGEGGALDGARTRSRHRASAREEALDYVAADGDEELFQRLRALRKRLAGERGVPPYLIFNDATLRAMVRRKPRDREALLQVPGVGTTKLERYGDAFLEVIARS